MFYILIGIFAIDVSQYLSLINAHTVETTLTFRGYLTFQCKIDFISPNER